MEKPIQGFAPPTGPGTLFFLGRAMKRDGAVMLNSLCIASCIIPCRQLSKKESKNELNSSKLKKNEIINDKHLPFYTDI